MEGDRGSPPTAQNSISSPAVRVRGVHVVPIRHHSPALARAVEHVIRSVRPQRVLVEGPSDANHLIDLLTDPQVVAPIALMAYRQPEPRGETARADLPPRFCFYPFCDYSPELVALRVARAMGIPARFCDIPACAVLGLSLSDDRHASLPPTDLSLWERVARRMGFRTHEEWWEAVFESGRLDTPTLLQQLQVWGELVLREGTPSELDDLRNAYMWHCVERVIAEGIPPEAILLVVGAAHSAAMARPDFHVPPDLNHPFLQNPPVEFAVIPFSFLRLSEQSGYGAGNRAPQFYQDVWEHGSLEMATCVALTRLVAQMQHQGDLASLADAIEAFRLAMVLASMRTKSQPGVDELRDACITIFGRGSAMRVQAPLRRVLIGERVGHVPPHGQRLPLQEEFYLLAQRLGIPIRDEPTDLRLNLAEPHAVHQSVFLHRVATAGIPFARYVGGEARTLAHLGHLREHWQVGWTPVIDIALAEAVRYGNTLREVASYQIRLQLTAHQDLESVSRAVFEAVLCDLPELYEEGLAALEEASIQEGDFVALATAAYRVAALIEYGASRSVRKEVFEPLLQRLYDRACFCLLTGAQCGDEEARTVGQGMQLIDEMARRLPDPEASLWRQSLYQIVLSELTHPYLRGIGAGLLMVNADEVERADLLRIIRRETSPANPPLRGAQLIEGLLDANPGLTRSRPLVAQLHEFLMSIPRDQFVRILPALRRAFRSLSRSSRDYLIAHLQSILLEEASPIHRWMGSLTVEIEPSEVESLLHALEWLCTPSPRNSVRLSDMPSH